MVIFLEIDISFRSETNISFLQGKAQAGAPGSGSCKIPKGSSVTENQWQVRSGTGERIGNR